MSRSSALAALLLLLPAMVWAQRMGAPGRGNHPIDLRVHVVWDNDRPVENQRFYVQLMTDFGVQVGAAYTDDDGRASFGEVSAGNYRLHVSGDGIRDSDQQFYIDPDESFHLESVRVRSLQPASGAAPPGVAPTVSAMDLKVPKKARKEFEKGNEEATGKHWAAAEASFQAAIRDYPGYAMAYNNLGIVLFQAGDPPGARAAFQKALDVDDHYSQAYVNLGRLLYYQQDDAAAEGLMQKALAVNPLNLDALIVLASSELRLGKYQLSADNARKVHDLQQPACAPPCLHAPAPAVDHYSVAHFIAGRALELDHQPEPAAKQFQLYLAEFPDGPLAPRARAELLWLGKQATAPNP